MLSNPIPSTISTDLLSKHELSQLIHTLFRTITSLSHENNTLRSQLAFYKSQTIASSSLNSELSLLESTTLPLSIHPFIPYIPLETQEYDSLATINSIGSKSSKSQLKCITSPLPRSTSQPPDSNKHISISTPQDDSENTNIPETPLPINHSLFVMHLLCQDILKIVWACTQSFISAKEAKELNEKAEPGQPNAEVRQSVPKVPINLTPIESVLIMNSVEDRLVQLATQLLSTENDCDILRAHIQSYYQHMAIDRVIRREQLTKAVAGVGQTNANAHAGSNNAGAAPSNPDLPTGSPSFAPSFSPTIGQSISLGVDSCLIRQGSNYSFKTGGGSSQFKFGEGFLDFGQVNNEHFMTEVMTGYSDPEAMMQFVNFDKLDL